MALTPIVGKKVSELPQLPAVSADQLLVVADPATGIAYKVVASTYFNEIQSSVSPSVLKWVCGVFGGAVPGTQVIVDSRLENRNVTLIVYGQLPIQSGFTHDGTNPTDNQLVLPFVINNGDVIHAFLD